MNISKRINRNVALSMTAAATGKSVRFTYVNRKGQTARRTVAPSSLRPTALGVVLTATDTEGPKSFRLDRMSRMQVL